MLASFEHAMRVLIDFPEAGRRRDDLASGVRSLSVEGYLLFYRLTEDGVVLDRILHGRRDIAPELF